MVRSSHSCWQFEQILCKVTHLLLSVAPLQKILVSLNSVLNADLELKSWALPGRPSAEEWGDSGGSGKAIFVISLTAQFLLKPRCSYLCSI